MVISYLGKSLVKLQVGDLVVALNPFEKGENGKPVKFGADIVLISCTDEDHSAVDAVTYGSKIPFVADSAGEYEIGGTYVSGFLTDTISIKKSKTFPAGKKLNTSYCVYLESINVCTLGAQKNEEIDAKLMEKMGEIDVLILPVGEGDTLSIKGAYKVAKQLDPKIIIPVAYGKSDEKKGVLADFLKELGASKTSTEDKLVLKKKDLEGKSGEVVLLKKG